jgi:hypothetical protein
VSDPLHVRTIRVGATRVGERELEVTGRLLDERPLPADAPSREADLWFVNTCQAWREDGPLHDRLRAGDREGLRALSARARRA